MKKLFIFTVACLSTVLTTTKTFAQDNAIARAMRQNQDFMAALSEDPGTGSPAAVASDRVSKKFSKQFAGITNANWTETNNGFVVWFMSHGIQNRVFLTRRGNSFAHIRYYYENELPVSVRHQIKSAYYDFAIISATEVRFDRATAYLVTIADKTTWKVIRIVDGEADVWKTYKKA